MARHIICDLCGQRIGTRSTDHMIYGYRPQPAMGSSLASLAPSAIPVPTPYEVKGEIKNIRFLISVLPAKGEDVSSSPTELDVCDICMKRTVLQWLGVSHDLAVMTVPAMGEAQPHRHDSLERLIEALEQLFKHRSEFHACTTEEEQLNLIQSILDNVKLDRAKGYFG
jgi:hypothetical protein